MGAFSRNSPAVVEFARNRLLANMATTAAIVVSRPVAVVAPQVAPFAWLLLAVSPAGSAAGARTWALTRPATASGRCRSRWR